MEKILRILFIPVKKILEFLALDFARSVPKDDVEDGRRRDAGDVATVSEFLRVEIGSPKISV